MKQRLIEFTVLITMMSFLGLSNLVAQKAKVFSPGKVLDLEQVRDVAISPDENYVAYTVSVPRSFSDSPGSDYRELHLYNLQTDEVRKLVAGKEVVSSLGWTPDSRAVTFRSRMDDVKHTQVFSIAPDSSKAGVLFEFPQSVRQYEFANSNTVIFTATDSLSEDAKDFNEKGFDIDIYEEEWRHISMYSVDLGTGETRKLTNGQTVYDFVVSPNGKTAAAAIASKNLTDYMYMFKDIYTVDLETGKTELMVDIAGKLGKLAWSPDGKKLAFQAASSRNDAVDGSLFVMDIPNSKSFDELQNYGADKELSVIDVGWKNEKTVLYAAEEGVDIVLSEQKVGSNDRTKIIDPRKVVFSGFDVSENLVAFPGNTSSHPSELFVFNLKDESLERKTHHNAWLNEVDLARQQKFEYEARDGKKIEGVLLYPLNYMAGNSYPLITYIHGGPEAAVQNGWTTRYSTWGQVAAARDYFVFMPNYRASSGRGIDFTMAGFGDLVGAEYNDVLDGIDALIDKGFVDPEKVGIGGGSYGGYFSAWSATRHTERFAASVVFVGVSDQVSKRFTTDIPYEDYYVHWGFWTHEDWKSVYDVSPVKYAHQSETPTLILHGTADPRVHPSQGLELYRALKLHSKSPVRLIWYGNEGHGNRINLNQYDYLVRTMDWFDYYLKSDKPKDQMPAKYPDFEF
ncbi:S9 family peptidase [Marinilabilia rubra]|uniref:Peptidase S9 prolyl oligopeptidase catalytic domain-containing protein n=1 Tax=Marinilabilia rubra TaxID=2162893 RepID=A0A2U2B642_9BACT|nr:prolyl oligopeptidase family serine peptidase [Marinilabilia rubra]PWD98504.1 hypothetical protein DDZ16_14790 [Marinilabilia rubra]